MAGRKKAGWPRGRAGWGAALGGERGFGFDQGTRGKIAEPGEPTALTAVHPPQLAITTPKPRQTGHDSRHDPQLGNSTPKFGRSVPKTRITHPAAQQRDSLSNARGLRAPQPLLPRGHPTFPTRP